MEQEPAIIVKNLSKNFELPQHKNTSVKQIFVNLGRRNSKKVKQQVLHDISFDIKKGEFFGIVGRNGSGKSTLLKLLAGVYTPTAGGTIINGRLTPFIELGVGFNPQLSGRDNVFLNGALLGFSHKEMQVMYEDIVDFADLRPFMDQKLKNYSSGMQVRLAFSIAVKAHNDILIFDEVLAVGDEAFQRKCLDIFEQHKANKQTVVLVTHDMETVKKFCSRAMLLNDGQILEIGDPRKVANKYSELNQAEIDRDTAQTNDTRQETKYLKAELLNGHGQSQQSFKLGDTGIVRVTWPGLAASQIESIGIHVFKKSGEHITGINSRTGPKIDWLHTSALELEISLNMTKGSYYLVIEAFKQAGQMIDTLDGPQFSVTFHDEMEWSGLVELDHHWRRVVT